MKQTSYATVKNLISSLAEEGIYTRHLDTLR